MNDYLTAPKHEIHIGRCVSKKGICMKNIPILIQRLQNSGKWCAK